MAWLLGQRQLKKNRLIKEGPGEAPREAPGRWSSITDQLTYRSQSGIRAQSSQLSTKIRVGNYFTALLLPVSHLFRELLESSKDRLQRIN